MDNTTKTLSIFCCAFSAAWAELSTDDAIASYKAKGFEDICTTANAFFYASTMAYMMGCMAAELVDQFIDGSLIKPLAIAPAVEPQADDDDTIDAEIISVTQALPPVMNDVIAHAMVQREAFKRYVLSVMVKNAHHSTARELKRMLGIPSSSRMKKAQVLALLPEVTHV